MRQPWSARVQQPGWVLLPLRAFLSVVFLTGGLSKVADPRFLDDSSPLSMRASVAAIRHTSPIGGLLGPVQDHAFGFGILMAVVEIAIGLGTLLGLFARVAAAGGMLVSLSLWLTVSWGAAPWFTSADLVYLFAFTPLLIAGAGALSLDGWLDRVREQHPGTSEDRTRRALVAAGVAFAGAIALGGSALARPAKRTARERAADTALPPQPLVRTDEVPIGGGKQVTIASIDAPAWVLQLGRDQFTAFDARCPHQGCTVEFVSPADGFACPCHHSHFDARGRRISGPAPTGLTPIQVTVADGEVRTT